MEILLVYLCLFSLNCILTIYLFRELKLEEQDKIKIKILSWSIIIINFLTLFGTLFLVFHKKIKVFYK
jgi:hypothetical protein